MEPSVEIATKDLGLAVAAQLGHRFDFKLPDALPGDVMNLADFIQSAWLAVGEPEAQPDDAGFALG